MKRDKAFFFFRSFCELFENISHISFDCWIKFRPYKSQFFTRHTIDLPLFFNSSPFCLKQLVRTFKQTHKTFEVFEIQEILKLNMKFSHKIELNFILFDYIVFELYRVHFLSTCAIAVDISLSLFLCVCV